MSLLEAFNIPERGDLTDQYEVVVKHLTESVLGIRATSVGGTSDRAMTADRDRRKAIAERLRWYQDDHEQDIHALIDLVYVHTKNKQDRKKLIALCMARNVSRRVVDEISYVYAKEATRTFMSPGVDADGMPEANPLTEQYRQVIAMLEADELLEEAEKLVNLCNEVLLWMAPNPIAADGEDNRRLQIITPDQFSVIPDHRDPLQVAGYIIDTDPGKTGILTADAGRPVWTIYDDTVMITLNENGKIIEVTEHGLPEIPGVLAHRRKPTRADRGLMDQTSGKDIISAHRAVLFLHLCIIRLSKSQGERQPILSGILSNIAKNQPLDGESPIALPPGVTMDMLDSKTDPEHYLKAVREFIGGVANTYGLSYEQFTFTETADTTSGTAYEVRREKLNEIRNSSAKRWRRIEPKIATVLRFPGEEMTTDFHERNIPQDAEAELRVLRDKMKLGLDTPLDFMMRKDPDLKRDQAVIRLKANLLTNAKIWEIQAKRNMPANADGENPGNTAEDNGSLGGRDSSSGGTPGDTGSNPETRLTEAEAQESSA